LPWQRCDRHRRPRVSGKETAACLSEMSWLRSLGGGSVHSRGPVGGLQIDRTKAIMVRRPPDSARRPEPKGIGIIVSQLGAEIIGSPPRKAGRIEQREPLSPQGCAGRCHMENAAYFRARAGRCLRLASLLSDPHAAQALVAKAAELHGHALELEQRTPFQKS
jgi:hypothetical protein